MTRLGSEVNILISVGRPKAAHLSEGCGTVLGGILERFGGGWPGGFFYCFYSDVQVFLVCYNPASPDLYKDNKSGVKIRGWDRS